ncbi:hypothetical protein McpAg1_02950 [Methanocorpusculaceae archaeon Ag1]|uniref:Uncharacterized protein n=1 Tax=Methanorbis furvi TaxID=3028299 RepID=A0AAE4MB39_9EURY|nr:hypothetical protein [Methanocorpusculaceae archaeon Ag1]
MIKIFWASEFFVFEGVISVMFLVRLRSCVFGGCYFFAMMNYEHFQYARSGVYMLVCRILFCNTPRTEKQMTVPVVLVLHKFFWFSLTLLMICFIYPLKFSDILIDLREFSYIL